MCNSTFKALFLKLQNFPLHPNLIVNFNIDRYTSSVPQYGFPRIVQIRSAFQSITLFQVKIHDRQIWLLMYVLSFQFLVRVSNITTPIQYNWTNNGSNIHKVLSTLLVQDIINLLIESKVIEEFAFVNQKISDP